MNARLVAGAATLGAVAVGLAVIFDLSALRMIFAVAVCLLLPGLGWARRFRLADRGDTLALAVVLSIGTTVAVATAMAVSGWWSTIAGLAALVAVAVTGFVPTARVLARLGAVFPAPATLPGDEWVDWYRQHSRHAEQERQVAESEWVDWYADARRRAAEDRAREAAIQREADEEWAQWYRNAHPERVSTWDKVSS